MELFRREALEHRAARLEGEVALAQPLSWTIAGGLLMLAVLAALAALLLIHVPRLAPAVGVIAGRDARLIVPAEARIGDPVRLHPDVIGSEIELDGRIVAIAPGAALHRIGGRTAAGRIARARLDGALLPAGTPARATVRIGREPLIAALSG